MKTITYRHLFASHSQIRAAQILLARISRDRDYTPKR